MTQQLASILSSSPGSPIDSDGIIEGGDKSPSSLASSLTPQTPPIQIREFTSEDGYVTRIYHHPLHRSAPVRVIRAEEAIQVDVPELFPEAATCDNLHVNPGHLQIEQPSAVTRQRTLVSVDTPVEKTPLPGTMLVEEKKLMTLDASSDGEVSEMLPSSNSLDPKRNSTVIMSRNVVIINSRKNSDTPALAGGVCKGETRTVVRKTRDGRTKTYVIDTKTSRRVRE